MRVIERKQSIVEFTCPKCSSRLGIEKGDVSYYTDMGGTRSPYITCPVCGGTCDVEGLKGLWRVL